MPVYSEHPHVRCAPCLQEKTMPIYRESEEGTGGRPCLDILRFGNRLFACGGDRDHPGYHLHSGRDDDGSRYVIVWGTGAEAPSAEARP